MTTHERHVNCPTSLCTRIAMEFNNKELSDVKLTVGDKEFFAHRMILASQSEMFRIMFMGSQWVESTQANISLTETKESEEVFHEFLSFFYSARIHLTKDNIVAVRILADKYQHIQLEKECDRFIARIISQDDTHTIVTWLVSIKNLGEKLEQRCLNKLQMEFLKLMTSEESRALLNLELLLKIVESDNVLVCNEQLLFNLVATWIMEKRHTSSQKSAITKLLPHIRFSHMTIPELAKVEKSPLGIKYPEMIIRHMFEAYKSRAQNANLRDKADGDAKEELEPMDSILPRMYTDSPWGAGYTKDSDTFLSSEFDYMSFTCPVVDRKIRPCTISKMPQSWTVSYKKEVKSYIESEDQVINRKLVTHDMNFKYKFGEEQRNYEIVIITGYIPKEEEGVTAGFQMISTRRHHGTIKKISNKTQNRRKIRLTEVHKPALLAGSEYVFSLGIYMQDSYKE
ncbi:kelch-like protein diablo [Asterias amurensis]|uniref:kelch-like protein diablo n=1 Tax=Asterias amurensis TaxID=7602 RepID=UPI003AB2611E